MRCFARTHLLNGEVHRCTQLVHDASDDFCYYHGKMAAGHLEPLDANDSLGEFDKDNGVHYVDSRRGEVLWFAPEPVSEEAKEEPASEATPVAA